VQRMFERSISELDVRQILELGEIIESYPDELPLPYSPHPGLLRQSPRAYRCRRCA